MVLTFRLWGGRSLIFSPEKKISPLLGLVKPPIILNVVVLPQPEGPKSVINSPSIISRLRLSNIMFSSNEIFIF